MTLCQITELPPGTWTNDYKSFLIKLLDDGVIKGFSEHHTSTAVKFLISANQAWIDELQAENYKQLKLDDKISMLNMHAYDSTGKIRRYDSAEDIVAEHYAVRKDAYDRRKTMLCQQLAVDVAVSQNKSRFIAGILDGSINLLGGKVAEGDVLSQLRAQNFETWAEIQDKGNVKCTQPVASTEDYSYLLNMPIHSLTESRYQSLVQAAARSSQEHSAMLATAPETLWLQDIQKFVKLLDEEYN